MNAGFYLKHVFSDYVVLGQTLSQFLGVIVKILANLEEIFICSIFSYNMNNKKVRILTCTAPISDLFSTGKSVIPPFAINVY